jgi:hypothetical protein
MSDKFGSYTGQKFYHYVITSTFASFLISYQYLNKEILMKLN